MKHTAVTGVAADRAFARFAGEGGRRRAQVSQRRDVLSVGGVRAGFFGVKLDAPADDLLRSRSIHSARARIAVDDSPLGIDDVNRPIALVEQFGEGIGDGEWACHGSMSGVTWHSPA